MPWRSMGSCMVQSRRRGKTLRRARPTRQANHRAATDRGSRCLPRPLSVGVQADVCPMAWWKCLPSGKISRGIIGGWSAGAAAAD